MKSTIHQALRRAAPSASVTIVLAGLAVASTAIPFWEDGAFSAVPEPVGSVYTADE